ncbi:MAG: DinB family protein [Acidimicrobiales bacterium]
MTTTEQRDLLQTLDTHRSLFKRALDGMTDEQIAARPTVSELCLGGIVKHLTAVERTWASFVVNGPRALTSMEEAVSQHRANFQVGASDSLDSLLGEYDRAARETDEVLERTQDLDADQALPEAPWFEKGARWTARRTFAHLIAETAQHAGHADIIRETIDGAKTMG